MIQCRGITKCSATPEQKLNLSKDIDCLIWRNVFEMDLERTIRECESMMRAQTTATG